MRGCAIAIVLEIGRSSEDGGSAAVVLAIGIVPLLVRLHLSDLLCRAKLEILVNRLQFEQFVYKAGSRIGLLTGCFFVFGCFFFEESLTDFGAGFLFEGLVDLYFTLLIFDCLVRDFDFLVGGSLEAGCGFLDSWSPDFDLGLLDDGLAFDC